MCADLVNRIRDLEAELAEAHREISNLEDALYSEQAYADLALEDCE